MRLASMLTFWTAHSSFFFIFINKHPRHWFACKSSDSIRAAIDIFLCRLSKTKNFHQIWRWQFNSCFWIKCSCKFSFRIKLIQLLAVYTIRLSLRNSGVVPSFNFRLLATTLSLQYFFAALFFDCIWCFFFCLSSIVCWTSFKESCSNSITTTFSGTSYVCFIFNLLAEIGVKFSRKEF